MERVLRRALGTVVTGRQGGGDVEREEVVTVGEVRFVRLFVLFMW